MGLLAVVRHVTHAPLRARKLGRLISLSLSLSLCLAPFPSLSLALAARWQRQRAAHFSRSKLHGDCGARSVAASYKPPMLVTRARLPACAICSAALLRSPTSGARFTYHCSAALPAGMQCRSPLCQTRGAKAPKTRRDAARGARRCRIDESTTAAKRVRAVAQGAIPQGRGLEQEDVGAACRATRTLTHRRALNAQKHKRAQRGLVGQALRADRLHGTYQFNADEVIGARQPIGASAVQGVGASIPGN